MDAPRWKLATRIVHAGGDVAMGPNPPVGGCIAASSVYALPDLAAIDRCYAGDDTSGFFYAALGHPNERALARAVADLEGAEDGIAAATGMGALSAILLSKLRSGDEIVAGREIYGGTRELLRRDLAALGITTKFVDASTATLVAQAVSERTRIVLLETLSNPLARPCPIDEIARLTTPRGVEIVVDNTFATPCLARPLEHGAHVVVHSATKSIGGHDDLMAGVAVGRRSRMETARGTLARLGLAASPFDCWLALRGLRTLGLRMERATTNARRIAEALSTHPRVSRVSHPALAGAMDGAVARRILRSIGAAILAFEIPGGAAAVDRFVRRLALIRFAPSLGGVRTTVSWPAGTSHRALQPAERAALGIGDGLVRLSTGIEDADDLIADLRHGLEG